jgi:CheY-like chemotaxis protein
VGEAVRIETVLSPEIWPCDIDAAQLEAALLNLAVNARDAMPEGGTLTIETRNVLQDHRLAARIAGAAAGPYVVVGVYDTGTGMPPEVLERAFEPFFTTKDVGKGTGLGLSQVYGFVEQSGGHVTIDSDPGAGTAIRLYLPPAELTPAARLLRGVAESGAEPTRGQERILLVEDNPDVLRVASAMLLDLGYDVRTASGPLEALDLLQPGGAPVDLLFSDIVMPQMSGTQLAEAARRLRPGLKVLLTSGYSRESAASRSALDRMLPVINKPYKQAELAAMLRAVLDG